MRGDWHLMQAHIRGVLADGDEEAERYILNWAAWATQNPGERAAAVLIFRGKEGTGKGVFLHALRQIFGVHGIYENSVERLTGKFNSQLQDALYLFADEISWSRRADADRLKSLVTDSIIQIEPKGLAAFPVTNGLRYDSILTCRAIKSDDS
jgi:phage/plasmid-associated DNA primase